MIGEVLGMAGGAHLGNERRGNFGFDLLTAGGVGAIGLLTLSHSGLSLAEFGLTFVAQLAATVVAERGITR